MKVSEIKELILALEFFRQLIKNNDADAETLTLLNSILLKIDMILDERENKKENKII